MIHARDVIFNEDEIFDGNLDKMRNDCLHIDLKKLAQLLAFLNIFSKSEEINQHSDSNDNCMINSKDLDEVIYEPKSEESQKLTQLAQQAVELMEQSLSEPHFGDEPHLFIQSYPTPPQSLPAALLATTIQGSEDSKLIKAFHSEKNNRRQKV